MEFSDVVNSKISVPYYSMAVINNHLTEEQRTLYDQFIKFFENDAEFRQNPNRLYSLAQTFLNVRFLCCSYDKRLMLKIKSMSDAFMNSEMNEEDPGCANHRKTKLAFDSEPNITKKARKDGVINADRAIPTCSNIDDVLKNFVLLRRADIKSFASILQMSAHFSRYVLKFEETSEKPAHKCEIYISDQGVETSRILIASAKRPIKKDAKNKASELAYDYLSKRCYSIIVRSGEDTLKSNIDPETAQIDLQKKLEQRKNKNPNDLLTGIGAKLMAKWGWTDGKGIGKNEQGIEKPVEILQRFARHGLGSVLIDKNFNKLVKSIIEEYSKSDEQDDLVFAANLSNEQRKFIHKMAGFFGLKHTSYGHGEKRQLTIKKPKSAMQLVDYLKKNEFETGIYQLVEPALQ